MDRDRGQLVIEWCRVHGRGLLISAVDSSGLAVAAPITSFRLRSGLARASALVDASQRC
jgi:hypothetical protein